MFSRVPSKLATKSRAFSTATGTTSTWTPKAQSFNVSQLKNGIKVATAENNNAVASIGVFINTGSRFETPQTLGATGVVKRLGFKSTKNLSELRLARSFELMGANYTVGVGREQIAYTAEVTADKVPQVLALLREVLSPQAFEYEIRLQRNLVERDTETMESDGVALLVELVHREAYRNKTLGNTPYTPTYRVNKVTDATVKQFLQQNYTNDKITIVVSGDVSHPNFVQVAEEVFGSRASEGQSASKEAAQYVGGELKIPGEFNSHVALAFEGASLTSAEYYPLAVLKAVLGGGRQLSKEGPGHGLTSRLTQNVLNANTFVDQVYSFNYNYTDSGLFGVYGIVKNNNPSNVKQFVNSVTAELKAVQNVSNEEVARAKEVVNAEFLFNNESRNGLLEFVGTQALTGSNQVKSPEQFLAGISAVSAQQVQAAAKKVFQSAPTVVALGEISELPTTDAIKKAVH